MPRVDLREIHKRFGSTRALRAADLEVRPGEVHALLGENGAGKTTLVRVLCGALRPDRGEIRVDGELRSFHGPREALELGIGLVHQHPMLVPALDVAENLALGEPGRLWLSRRALRSRAAEVLAAAGLDLEPDAPVSGLAVAQQQSLEIARVLARGVELLVLDEPTAVLAPSEVDALLALLARLRDQGRSVLLISHKLGEIAQVCDRVTVLRAGQTVALREVGGADAEELGRLMVGQAPAPPGRPPAPGDGAIALRLRGLRAEGLHDVDLELRGGEILAVAGIDGNGQGPLEEVLAGVRATRSGAIELTRPPLALLSGDRQRTGLVLDLSVEENLRLLDAASGGAPPIYRYGLARPRARREAALRALERFDIRAMPGAVAATLSGGNQQKLCVARALEREPGVLVAVNPTRGLDVASAAALRARFRQLASAGVAILLISTDLDEVLELGTRVAVLFRGTLQPLGAAESTRARIGQLMLGEPAP